MKTCEWQEISRLMRTAQRCTTGIVCPGHVMCFCVALPKGLALQSSKKSVLMQHGVKSILRALHYFSQGTRRQQASKLQANTREHSLTIQAYCSRLAPEHRA
jgi:hypothetical protein